MSYQVAGVCYDSTQSALTAMAADMFGASGSLTWASSPAFETSQIITTYSNGTAQIITPTLLECQQIDWVDAMQLCWLVIGVWAAAWAFKTMRHSVNNWGSGYDG